MVALEFDKVLLDYNVRLSGTPVRLQCFLLGRADAEHTLYHWLGFIWGLDPASPTGQPAFMVWVPSLDDWRYVSMAAFSPDGNRGDSLTVASVADLAGGLGDGVTEGGLAFDRDPISLGDVLDVAPGTGASVPPSPEHW